MNPLDSFRGAAVRRALLAIGVLGPTLSLAQPAVPAEAVVFARGADAATLRGRLKGPKTDARDYVVRARSGQVLSVDLATMSTSTYFDVLPPGGGAPMFTGRMNPHPHWSGIVRADGDYRVRVLLERREAREGRDASFTLTIVLR